MADRLAPLAEDEEVLDERLPESFRKKAENLAKFEDIVFGEEIGSGAFSKVFRGSYQGKEVAIKKMHLTERDAEKYLQTELGILK